MELGFPEIREMIACSEKLTGYKPYVTLADVRDNVKVTNEGKRVVEDLRNLPYFRGTAVLVSNSIYQFAVNFLNYYSKSQYPFRAFTSERKAIEWLMSLPLD